MAGDIYIAWSQINSLTGADIYLHKLTSGVPDLQFGLNGIAICRAIGDQFLPALIPGVDAIGVSWLDQRYQSIWDVYGTYIQSNGRLADAWALDGQAILRGFGAEAREALGLSLDGFFLACESEVLGGRVIVQDVPRTGLVALAAGSLTVGRVFVRPNPVTTIRDYVRIDWMNVADEPVRVNVFSVDGRILKTLELPQEAHGGLRSMSWDLRTARGEKVPPGLYFIRSSYHGGGQAVRLIVL
jgi:hypothetical protein